MYFKLSILTQLLFLSIQQFITEMVTLFRPHVELSPNTAPFVVLNHMFETCHNLQYRLELHITDIQTLTLSTIHVNDSLKKRVLPENPEFLNILLL